MWQIYHLFYINLYFCAKIIGLISKLKLTFVGLPNCKISHENSSLIFSNNFADFL